MRFKATLNDVVRLIKATLDPRVGLFVVENINISLRYYWVYVRRDDYGAAVRYIGRRDSRYTCRNYLYSLKRDLETFWKKELLDPADMWNRVADKAAKDLEDMEGR